MTNRTTREFVAFPWPFQLRGMSRMCPAGTYEIMTEEEPIGDFTYAAYRRLSTTIYVPRAAGRRSDWERSSRLTLQNCLNT
jgi:hypothetical protein